MRFAHHTTPHHTTLRTETETETKTETDLRHLVLVLQQRLDEVDEERIGSGGSLSYVWGWGLG